MSTDMSADMSTDTFPFASPAQLPLFSIDRVLSALFAEQAGATPPVLIVAPHPDDETLGCGGAIALLRERSYPVHVWVISDGTKSHPNSRRYPAAALRALRAGETRTALTHLGIADTAITFWDLPDGAVPLPEQPEFALAVERCQAQLIDLAPSLILLPWRYDPHPDHRASWWLLQGAMAELDYSPRLLEYPIWDWDPAQRQPLPQGIQVWRLDISSVLARKVQAMTAYRSQITDLIDDDPSGFRLTPDMLAPFQQPWEMYLEASKAALAVDPAPVSDSGLVNLDIKSRGRSWLSLDYHLAF